MLSIVKATVAVMLCLAAPVFAQGVVSLGDIRIDPRFTVPAEWQFTLTSTEGGAITPIGTLVERWSESEMGGRRVLVKDGAIESEGVREHVVLDRETLAPIAISLTTKNRQNDLQFAGRHVSGSARFHGNTENVSLEMGRPLFAGNTFYLVLRSLPLADGMSRTVGFFRAFDLKEVEVTFTVLGGDTFTIGADTVPVWFVMTKEKSDPGLGLYWIRKDNHAIARIVTFNEGGQQVTMMPKPDV